MDESMIGTGSTAARVAIDLAISLTQTSHDISYTSSHITPHHQHLFFCSLSFSKKEGRGVTSKREAPSRRLISRTNCKLALSRFFTPPNQNPNLFRLLLDLLHSSQIFFCQVIDCDIVIAGLEL